jgi:haloalkane dehalogenase
MLFQGLMLALLLAAPGDSAMPPDAVPEALQPAFLRTDDARFEGLPDYPFQPHYAEVAGLRVHYLDEGPREGPVMLLLHGEPSWSYLYRHMIPPLAAAGYRVIAPDLVGFGKSDKPTRREDYSYAAHVEWLRALLFERLALADITLFAQDWGGLIGLRLVGEHPERFARLALSNTFLPDGSGEMPEAFLRWREFSQAVPEFPSGRILQMATSRQLSDAEMAAYDAPFPEERHKAGARAFPMLVPTTADDPALPANRAAWVVLEQWSKPLLTLFSDSDPITAGLDRVFRERVPGAAGQPHRTIVGAHHFVQEDAAAELAAVLLAWAPGPEADRAGLRRAEGSFVPKRTPLGEPLDEDGVVLARERLEKAFEGDLEGSGDGEMLTAMTPVRGSAGYVALERVTGRLHGREGSFALQHHGLMRRGEPSLALVVVPDSGTGALAGIEGEMAIEIGAEGHRYRFDYSLPREADAGSP